jgi:ankyrin repeat protein
MESAGFGTGLFDLTTLKQQFFNAVVSGDTCSTKSLLSEQELDLNTIDDCGYTALHHAASRNDTKMMKLLHAHGSDVDAQTGDESGVSAAHIAALYGNLQAIVVLHQLGCNMSAFDNSDLTPLHYAVDCEDVATVEVLLNHSASVRACGSSGAPLHLAAQKGNNKIVMLLVQKGLPADIDIQDNHGCTPLHLAASNGWLNTTKLLVWMGADMLCLSVDGKAPADLATDNRHAVILNYFTRTQDNVFSNFSNCNPVLQRLGAALFIATVECSVLSVRYLVTCAHCPPDVEDNFGTTSLIIAAGRGDLIMCEVLIQLGANVNHVNKEGISVLMFAASRGHSIVVAKLIESGSKVDYVSPEYGSALHHAAYRLHSSVVKIILEHGCLIDIADGNYFTALDWAAENSNLSMCKFVVRLDRMEYRRLKPLQILNSLALSLTENRQTHVQFFIETLEQYRTHDITRLATTYGIPYFVLYGSLPCLMSCAINFNERFCLADRDRRDLLGFLHVAAINGNTDVFQVLTEEQLKSQINQFKDISTVCSTFFGENPLSGYTHLNPLQVCLLVLGGCRPIQLFGTLNLRKTPIRTKVYDYVAFCKQLIKVKPDIVNEMLADGRTPLNLARDFGLKEMAWMLLDKGGQTNPFLKHPDSAYTWHLEKSTSMTGIASTFKQHLLQRSFSQDGHWHLQDEADEIHLQSQPSLSEITEFVLPLISNRWLTVGRMLGVEETVLDATYEDTSTEEAKCRRVLKWWLEHCTRPTWRLLLGVIGQTDAKQQILVSLRRACQPQVMMGMSAHLEHSESDSSRTTMSSPTPYRQQLTGSQVMQSKFLQTYLNQNSCGNFPITTQAFHTQNIPNGYPQPLLSTTQHYPNHPPPTYHHNQHTPAQHPPTQHPPTQQPSTQHPSTHPSTHPPTHHPPTQHPPTQNPAPWIHSVQHPPTQIPHGNLHACYPTMLSLQKEVVSEVAYDWYKLGIFLEVDTNVLNNIDASFNMQVGRVERCCADLLLRWLRGDSGTGATPRTWATLVSAIENISPPLAEELQVKYCV